MSKSRIPNIVLPGEVDEGFRRPGRPKKSFREGLRNDLKAFQLWPKYIAQKKIDRLVEDRKEWRKTINSAAQKIQEQWEQTKIDTSNERKQAKSRNVIVFTDPFFMIIIIIINFIFYNCVVIYSLSPPISCMA